MELLLTDQVAGAEATQEPAGAAAGGVQGTPNAGSATPAASAEAGASPQASADAPTPEKSILGAEPEKKPDGAAQAKPADGKDPAAKAEDPKPLDPKDYKVEFPEGLKADDANSAKFLDAAAKLGLSNDAVQTLVKEIGPHFAEMAKQASDFAASFQNFQDMNKSWQSECQSDPEFGGAKLEDTRAMVMKAWDATLSPEEKKGVMSALNLTGAGNHPDVFRAFARLASRISEGGPVGGGKPAAGARTAAEIMYPNQARAS